MMRMTRSPKRGGAVLLAVKSLAYGGDGVARAEDGRAVFVRGGCPGDTVEAEIVADKGRFLRASVREVLDPSAQRVKPPCPYFGECGGCQWQHVSYAAQVSAKRQSVADALARIGHVSDYTLDDVVMGPESYGYRNKAEFTVGRVDGEMRLGYLTAGGRDLVNISSCLLLPASHRKAPGALAGVLRYLSNDTAADVSRVALRVAHRRSDVEVDLWGPPGGFPRQMAAKAFTSAVGANTVTRALLKGPAGERKVSRVEVLSGRGAWRERLGRYEYTVSAPSFFQVNTGAAERLVALVMEGLEPARKDRILDLYAGVGTFTLPLAAEAGETVAVEGEGSAIRDLRKNLEHARLRAVVVPGDATRALEGLGRFDGAVVDPPRSGMRASALHHLVASCPRRIVYVSCDPATLARDAALLRDAGYKLARVTPVDLFPQTYHVEAVALFIRS
jgi:23S rRNA (uracil1939-C5)-methyltransferase